MDKIIIIIARATNNIGGFIAGILGVIIGFCITLEFIKVMWFWLLLEFLFVWFFSRFLARFLCDLNIDGNTIKFFLVPLPFLFTFVNWNLYLASSTYVLGIFSLFIFSAALVVTCYIAIDDIVF